MSEDIFRQLQKRLDRYSMGFPETKSGIELKILKYLFSEDDAEMFLSLSHELESPESVSSRFSRPPEEVAALLDDMAERGLLFRQKKGGAVRYAAIPFVHGLFEFQVKNIEREFSEMVQQYFEEGFHRAIENGAEYFLRTVPVHESVKTGYNVAAYEDAVEILRGKDKIVVTDCICRKSMKIIDRSCDKPLEACFMFGSMGQYYLDRKMGRKVDVDEAKEILLKCHEAGLVTQPATAQNPGGMCNCCGDCCGVMRALNRHPKPAEIVFSNHYAVVDTGLCTGCETCIDRCQMEAVTLSEGVCEISLDRCIGCGLCVTTCPAGALELVTKPEEEYRTPPENTSEQMMLMAQKRGLV
ncbi:MAG: 4Fe-4S dicluster domain-containing protein [Deltaproteobacteria bacterium]|uniref:4Fe-4S dicluster domain-containing protein n=1 Tax=Candidatus Zymogenus saltonus TaxID=2844893 RepID=A0A9D8PLP5_9DELT|nr:4Fe-4S dicluster domain-containing protein [Candidatus Zymogenus saltonus]